MNAREFSEHAGIAYGTLMRYLMDGMPAERTDKPGSRRAVKIDPETAKAWIAERYPNTIAKDRVSYVYVARRLKDDALKIGFSSDVVRRLQELRKYDRTPVELVAMVPGKKPDELRLHKKFQTRRLAGEWFAANVDDVVRELARIVA